MAPCAVTEGTVKFCAIDAQTRGKWAAGSVKKDCSLDLGARCLDNGRPLRKLGLNEFARGQGRAARCRVDPRLLQRRGNRGISQGVVDRRVELVDDRFWRAGGGEKYVPRVAFKSRQTLFL